MRWMTRERTLLLAGDRTAVHVSVHDTDSFNTAEYRSFEASGQPPYLWQLDRGGPGNSLDWTYNGHRAAWDWQEAQEQLEAMLTSWAETLPVQAPGDWAGFRLRSARDPQTEMVVSYSPADEGEEFHAAVMGCHEEREPEQAARMRARGWQRMHAPYWWQIVLPETDPGAPAAITHVVITDLRERGTVIPAEVRAWDISVGDNGELWVPGIGFNVYPRRGEHL